MVLLIDNYDSFVYNLSHYLQELGREVRVARHDALEIRDLERLSPELIVLSPGPCDPARAGICLEVVRQFRRRIPILGVCLGHQCIGEAYGARVVRAPQPVHGQASRIFHRGSGEFAGLPSPFVAGRYHSLLVSAEGLPAALQVTAWTEDQLIMGLRDPEFPVIGFQFHPESILTDHGHQLLRNVLSLPRPQALPA